MRTKSVLFLICVFFFSCNKKDEGELSFSNNSFIAQRADATWQGTTEIGLTSSYTLIFLAVGNGLDNGVVVAKMKFDGIGSYTLNDLDGIYYNTLGSDVLISQYTIEDGSNGIFSNSAYDEGNRYIEGGFKMPLKATMLANPEIKDSTLTIFNGEFKGFIRKEI